MLQSDWCFFQRKLHSIGKMYCAVHRRCKKGTNCACKGCGFASDLTHCMLHRESRWIVRCHGLGRESCQYSQEECFANASFLLSLCWRRTRCATWPFWGSMRFTWNSVVMCWKFLLLQKHTELAPLFNDNVWVTKLAYLVDIFAELNKFIEQLAG